MRLGTLDTLECWNPRIDKAKQGEVIMSAIQLPTSVRLRATPEPLMVVLHRWYLESRTAVWDLVLMLVLGGTTYIFLLTHDFTELFFDFTRHYEDFELDEVLFTLIFVLAVFLPAFAIRRWFDAIRFLRQSNTDSLTKLANRRRGWRLLDVEIARAGRTSLPFQ